MKGITLRTLEVARHDAVILVSPESESSAVTDSSQRLTTLVTPSIVVCGGVWTAGANASS
jgi:hypothetical protein